MEYKDAVKILKNYDFFFLEEITKKLKENNTSHRKESYLRKYIKNKLILSGVNLDNFSFGKDRMCIALNNEYIIKFSYFNSRKTFEKEKNIYYKAKMINLEKFFLKPIKIFYLPKYNKLIYLYQKVELLKIPHPIKYDNNDPFKYIKDYLTEDEQNRLLFFFKQNNIYDIKHLGQYGLLNGQLKYIDYGE